MNPMNGLLLVAVAVGGLALVTKPGPERFERYITEQINAAKVDSAKRDQYLDALVLAGVGALRDGQYDDFIFWTKYRVSFFGKPLTTCYGYFAQVSCGHEG